MAPLNNERRFLLFLDFLFVGIMCASAAFSLVRGSQASWTQFVAMPGKQITAMVGWIWSPPTERGIQW